MQLCGQILHTVQPLKSQLNIAKVSTYDADVVKNFSRVTSESTCGNSSSIVVIDFAAAPCRRRWLVDLRSWKRAQRDMRPFATILPTTSSIDETSPPSVAY